MATHPAARATTEDIDESITGPVRDIATMFADLSTELGRFSERVLDRLADIEAGQRGEPRSPSEGGARSDGLPPPTTAQRSTTAPVPGEPVDTSFARPTRTPAARAAGVSPSQEPFRSTPSEQRAAPQHLGNPGSGAT